MLAAVLERGYGGVRTAAPGGRRMRAIAMGVHVLDVLARPVDAIPEGQGGQLVDEIRVTAAGSAGGTALVLAKLGAEVRSAGAIGDDVLGEMLVFLLRRAGRGPVAAGAARRRADLRQRAADPPERRPAGLPRDRRQRHLRRSRRAAGRDRARPPTSTWADPSSWAARTPRRSSRTRARTT